MSPSAKVKIEAIQQEYSAQGRRVLLLAHKAVCRSAVKSSPLYSAFEGEMVEQANSGLTPVGLVAIVDPPRPEIPEVIQTLRGAGVRIFMVMCDFALTAQAIAAECGIISTPAETVHDAFALSRASLTHPSGLNAFARHAAVPKSVHSDDHSYPTSIVVTAPGVLTSWP